MSCHDARDQFSALVDEALAPGERAALDAHLASCADCRRELQRFRDTVALVRAVGPARAPAGFVDRVLEAARPDPWYRRLVRGLFLPWPVKLPMEAAAIVLVAVGVALVYRGAPELRLATYSEQGPREMREGQAPPAMAPSKDQVPQTPPASTPSAPTPAAPPKVASSSPPPTPAPGAPAATGQPLALSRTAEPKQQPAERREGPAQAAAKLEALPGAAERAQALRDLQQSTATPEASADRAEASAAKRSAPPGTGSVALVAPAVSGRLAVSDRDAALRAVAELAARLGAAETRRADITDGQLLELMVPRDAYPEFVRELGRLGRWQPSTEPAELPAQVRVVLQITR